MATAKKVPKNIGQWGVLPHWILCHPKLSANAKLLVLALSMSDRGQGIFPSNDTLARMVNLKHGRSVPRIITKLEALGIVLRQKRSASSGRQTSNFFLLDLTEPGKRIPMPPKPTGTSTRKWRKNLE